MKNVVKPHIKTRLELAITLAVTQVKIRYKNSILGFFWSLLTPLVYLGIFVTVFGSRDTGTANYPLYVLSGLIFWNFFNTTTNQLLNSVVSSAGILKSINVPTLIFPISALFSSLINLTLSLIPFFILMLFFGLSIDWTSLQFFYTLLMLICFSLGFGMLLCAFNVFFRDIGMLWQTVVPAFFYSTPIVWTTHMLPDSAKIMIVAKMNPIFHFMVGFRASLYTNTWMTLSEFGIITALGVLTLLLGYRVFIKMEKGFYSHY